MKRKISVVLTCLVLFVVLTAESCTTQSVSDRKDRQTMDSALQQMMVNQPVPTFDWSQDRDTFIQIYELKNEARQTYTVVTSMNGQVVFRCPSIGYPIPADTQLTNPLKLASSDYSQSSVIEQAEPNGLFSSKNTDATYVLCVRKNGDVVPIYTENKASTFPMGVTVNAQGEIVDPGDTPTWAKVTPGKRK